MRELGGWGELYEQTDLMHLHLPADHPKLPWTAIGAMLLLNLNYWGSNQIILQRALAAKSVRHAQVGLLASGVLEVRDGGDHRGAEHRPGRDAEGPPAGRPGPGLPDPGQHAAAAGLRGLVLCGLFASLMSSVDSIFNSVSTLWSIDIYKRRLRPDGHRPRRWWPWAARPSWSPC